jgi:hypothetical protein
VGFPFSKSGAGNETRTRDLNLGKVALYQLSYSRIDLSMVGTSNEARIIAKEMQRFAGGCAQCGRVSVLLTGVAGTSAGTTAATVTGSSSGSACGIFSSATSSTLSIHFTGTISR